MTFDPAKRARTLEGRGLDFAEAAELFEGPTFEFEDTRKDYGERRIICFGRLPGRLIVAGYVVRGQARHVYSMRKANDREEAEFGKRLGEG
ncbi:MAG: BrnT family toxin [Alphaproteobacteria bacterium]|nr:BrnT family toxin [Alphaproteobacteria bacterium]